MRISDLGEFGLIDLVSEKLPALSSRVLKGIGDDTAVLKTKEGKLMLITTDMLIEDVHFALRYQPCKSIGWKALAVNISDIAAMGGQPDFAVVSLGLPADLPVGQVEDIYHGLADCAGRYGVDIVGGDTVRSPQGLIINVALTGHVEPSAVIYRSGARPGDHIMVAGQLGQSAAGLYMLNNDLPNVGSEARETAIRAHFFPQPRAQEGVTLASSGLVTAMNDISDGLASELLEICRASQVGCEIWGSEIPISDAVVEISLAAGESGLDWALCGGEDFALVFTVDPKGASSIQASLSAMGCPTRTIGMITQQEKECKLIVEGTSLPLTPGGYNHFRD